MPNKTLTDWIELTFQFILAQHHRINNKSNTVNETDLLRELQTIPKKQLQWILNGATRKAQKEIKGIKQKTLQTARKTLEEQGKNQKPRSTKTPHKEIQTLRNKKDTNREREATTNRSYTEATLKQIGEQNQGDTTPRLHTLNNTDTPKTTTQPRTKTTPT